MPLISGSSFPPAPWVLRGKAWLAVRLVPLAEARRTVPDGLRVVPVWPGRTLGGIAIARYGAGSTLEYCELVVSPALVRRGAAVGAWISQIYVDTAASVAGGRAIWRLPKELAKFDWAPFGASVRQDERVICSVAFPSMRQAGLPLAAPVPAFGTLGGPPARFVARAAARVRCMRAEWRVPADSPLAGLGLDGPALTVRLEGLRVVVAAP